MKVFLLQPLLKLSRGWRTLRRRQRSSFTLIAAVVALPLLLAIFYFLKPSVTTANWFDGNFGYRQRLDLTSISTAQTDFQVKITLNTSSLITAGKMQNDCDDIRVTDVNGRVLPYWIENGTNACNTSTTAIWTKVPSIPTSGATLYVYYQNPLATSAQNGKDVFTFFDDFSGDLSSWTNPAGCAGSISSGVLQISTSTGCDETPMYITGQALSDSTGYILELRGQFVSGGSDRLQVYPRYRSSNGYSARFWRSGTSTNYQEYTGSFGGNTDVGNSGISADTWYNLRARVNGTNNTWAVNNSTIGSATTSTASLHTQTDFSIALGQYQTTVQYDDVRLRKYVATEPTVTAASEETAPGPVAQWKFDEGQGQTIQDTTANNNDGTLGANSSASTDDPAWVTEDQCVSGKCLQFDGSSDYATVPKSVLKDDGSISVWVNTTSLTTRQHIVYGGAVGEDGWSPGPEFHLSVETDGTIHFNLYNSGQIFALSTALPSSNNWHHVSAVWSDTNNFAKIYINGIEKATVTVNVGSLNTAAWESSMYLGRSSSTAVNTRYFSGKMDEVKIYPYARSAAQVKADFNAGATALGIADQTALSDGLVGYWKMDDASVDAEGETSTDSSGNNNTATLYGDNSTGDNGSGLDCTTAGKFGTGCTVDGTDDYLQVSNASSWASPTTLTYSIWVNPSSVSGTTSFMNSRQNSTNNGLELTNINGSIRFAVRVSGGGEVSVASALTTGTWQHIVATYNNTTREMHLYKNGVLIGSGTSASSLGAVTGPLTLGASQNSGSGSAYFNGLMDEARVYSRALSPDEVKSLYNFAPGPVGHWRFEESSGSTAIDSSGNSLSGTITNATYTSGKMGGGLSFDGDTDYVTVTNNALLNFPHLTACVWAKRTGAGSGDAYQVLLDKQQWNDSGYTLLLDAEDTGANWRVLSTDSNNTHDVSASSLTTSDWHYYCGVFNGSTTSLYVDGILKNSKSASYVPNSNNLIIGVNASGDGDFQGIMDEIVVYNYARTPAQIQQDMQGSGQVAATGGGGEKLPTPLYHWALDAQQGQNVHRTGLGGTSSTGTLGANSSASTDDPTWKTKANCKINGCMTFDGTADYVDTNSPADFDAPESFSVSAWINSSYLEGSSAALHHIVGTGFGFSETYALMYRASTTTADIRFGIHDGAGNQITAISTKADMNDGQWHHVAGVRDVVADRIYVYIDGVLQGSTADTTTGDFDRGSDVFIGTRGVGAAEYFPGSIDEVKIYSAALTADQIIQDMNAGSPLNFGTTSSSEDTQISGGAGNPPVAYWKFDENTGSTVYDTSGSNNTGTLVNTPEWTSGKTGAALYYNGSNQNTDLTTTNFSNTAGTASFWTKPAIAPDGTDEMMMLLSADPNRIYLIRRGSTGNLITRLGSNADEDTGVTLAANQWHHVTLTWNNGNFVTYINGVQVDSGTYGGLTSISSCASIASFTNCSGSKGNRFQGTIDDLKIYNYARTQAQVAYDYNRGAPVAHWKLDECQGTTVNDASGNGNSGSITIGGSGAQTSVGTCSTSGTAWGNGASGKYGASLRFDGNDDLITVTGSGTTMPATFTYAAWVKPAASIGNANYQIMGKKSAGCNFGQAQLVARNNIVRFNVHNAAGTCSAATASSGTILSTGVWTHVMGTFDGTTARLYINGHEVSSGAYSGTFNTSPTADFVIGSDNTFFINATIDDVRVYNYTLSSTQAKKVYNEGSSVRFGP